MLNIAMENNICSVLSAGTSMLPQRAAVGQSHCASLSVSSSQLAADWRSANMLPEGAMASQPLCVY